MTTMTTMTNKEISFFDYLGPDNTIVGMLSVLGFTCSFGPEIFDGTAVEVLGHQILIGKAAGLLFGVSGLLLLASNLVGYLRERNAPEIPINRPPC